jgi:hypothetical protein
VEQLDAKQRLRQETLSAATQNSFREKDKERRRHSVEQAHRESNEAQSCSKTLNTLTERLEQGYSKSFEVVQRRVGLNKQHADRVEATLNQVLLNEQRRVSAQLHKAVQKARPPITRNMSRRPSSRTRCTKSPKSSRRSSPSTPTPSHQSKANCGRTMRSRRDDRRRRS